jgi:hypothetical protein
VRIAADNPIRKVEDDALGRAKVAHSFAENVLSLDANEGVVVGVLGPWGAGKTSFINLARTRLEAVGIAVLDFNPWMFSGTEQLVESFFVELSAQLRLRPGLATVGKDLEEYGETLSGLGWLPLVGAWIERGRTAAGVVAKILQRRKEGVSKQRAKIENALSALDRPLIVVVDDIDRLTNSEIRDVFKLVRLTASFPNVIYILAFDRKRVEKALADQGIPGRDYIEKILQVAVDIPAVPAGVLNKEALQAIDKAISTIDSKGPFDESAWPDVYMEVIRPLLRNMRDVRRYTATIHGTVRDLDGQISLVDVLALEAVRVFLPEVFHEMHGAVDGLTTTSDAHGGDNPRLKGRINRLIETADAHGDVIRALIGRVFPAARRHIENNHFGSEWKRQWLRERRVAHEDILRLYLERITGEGLQAFTDAEHAWGRMTDRTAFDTCLRSLDADRLLDVIGSLEAFEADFGPEHIVPGSVVLLNILPELSESRSGMLALPPMIVVGRVVYRLVRSLKRPDAIEEAVREILPAVSTLYSRLDLIDTIGYRENVGHRLVSEAAARNFEKEWRDQVRAASADTLGAEKGLLWTLLYARKLAEPAEPPLEVPDSPRVTSALLQSAYTEVLGQAMGSRAVSRSARLGWNELIELYGDERILLQRIEKLKAARFEGHDELLQLADKYIGGWRPPDFGRR